MTSRDTKPQTEEGEGISPSQERQDCNHKASVFESFANKKTVWTDMNLLLMLQYPPDKDELAKALRSDEPVPKVVRHYLAGMIDQMKSLPKRRGKKRDWWQTVRAEMRDDFIRTGIPVLRDHFKKQDQSDRFVTPIECAFEEMEKILRKKGHDIGVDRIKKIYYSDPKPHPLSYW